MGSLFGEVYYINPTMSTILHHGIGRLGLLYTESATGLLLLDNSYEMVHSYIYQAVRGYTAHKPPSWSMPITYLSGNTYYKAIVNQPITAGKLMLNRGVASYAFIWCMWFYLVQELLRCICFSTLIPISITLFLISSTKTWVHVNNFI